MWFEKTKYERKWWILCVRDHISLLCCIVAAPQQGLNIGSKETNFKILKEAILSAVVELLDCCWFFITISDDL